MRSSARPASRTVSRRRGRLSLPALSPTGQASTYPYSQSPAARPLRAMAGDILLDFGSCRSMPFACRHPGHQHPDNCTPSSTGQPAAAGSGHIAASRLLQYGDERRRHRLVVSQQGINGNGPGLAVALQDAGIRPELAAKSGIKKLGG